MEPSSRDIKVGVLGHYGNQNLGDEAIITATVQHIERRLPNAQIIGISISPDDTAARFNIPSYPIRNVRRSSGPAANASAPAADARAAATGGLSTSEPALLRIKNALKRVPVLAVGIRWTGRVVRIAESIVLELGFLARSYRFIKGWRLIVVAGSNQFLDNFGGAWGFPYTVLKWTLLAKASGAKIAFVSVGAGPLTGTLSKLFVRCALSLADSISYRDESSKTMVEAWPYRFRGAVYPDLANSLLFQGEGRAVAATGTAPKPVVGINPMPVFHQLYWHEWDEDRYRGYVARLQEFATFLLTEGYPLFFFPTQAKDEIVIRDILAGLDPALAPPESHAAMVRSCREVSELMAVIETADIVVPTRFHGAVLALHARKAVLAVCYYRKTRDLLIDRGQGAYAVDLQDFDAAELIEKFKALAANIRSELAKITVKNAEYRAALDRQYEAVFRLVR
ncbi:polysaccharide pyruvyl transferase family protein [Piscinibacter sp.]|uniref:polysaccharide pyruvyl transferase family protein n=1 Tax=Piscinibacter sp. TaxID=1903157 RepID=UPI002B5A5A63|nr:polysaccharide pyruvyl transferase family protein [Albitalea sp.]HUG24878.1 polysaccharide pyruvyl transferase family protein [Albitalea sp.]